VSGQRTALAAIQRFAGRCNPSSPDAADRASPRLNREPLGCPRIRPARPDSRARVIESSPSRIRRRRRHVATCGDIGRSQSVRTPKRQRVPELRPPRRRALPVIPDAIGLGVESDSLLEEQVIVELVPSLPPIRPALQRPCLFRIGKISRVPFFFLGGQRFGVRGGAVVSRRWVHESRTRCAGASG
jgi:hypothetical protein